MIPMIEITAADGFRFPIYQAQPTGPAKGAVVVLQEIFGVNVHIRAVADSFAAQGYFALAPSTFHRVKPGVEMGYKPDDIAAGVALKAQVEGLPAPGVLLDIQATIDYAMRSVPSGKVGVVGYCWGGLLAWRAACELSHIAAAVTYYGGGMTQPVEIARTSQVPVLAHFARNDHSISLEGVDAFRLAQPEVELYLYDASHGFNCDNRAAYNAAAATLARTRTLDFLEKIML
ncbi:dienelactone hydrolase family protein [Rhodoferax sp.]|uniref:dienelactone hydrolase family protein n=1 Tax=Rhodoferax sp. TaxID=50421 RepID=UPI00284E6465|nr:dienelactone hydrolase family protein [Rhodoferax sp.]MDR3367914.1 dienelactone hydrolase family protein [Rhodoferax sp.]